MWSNKVATLLLGNMSAVEFFLLILIKIPNKIRIPLLPTGTLPVVLATYIHIYIHVHREVYKMK